jgi:POT family proton-dependent oligopeptide transporter
VAESLKPAIPEPPSTDRGFFGHPRGLSTLFFTEMWERFGYYGMRSLLILFMTAPVAAGGLGLGVPKAAAIYGIYTSMVYMACLPGGWIADRFLGHQRAVLVGGVVMSVGYLMLAVPGAAPFYGGLFLVVLGTGLLKPNVSTIVGQLYGPADRRRDAGFSVFYMGINLGAFLAPLACGYVGERRDYRWGLALAGLGMVAGVVTFAAGRSRLGDAGSRPAPKTEAEASRARRQLRTGAGVVTLLAAAGVAAQALGWISWTAESLVAVAGLLLFGIVAVLFGWLFLAGDWTPLERKRLLAILVLFLISCLFWSVFEQAGSTLNLFAKQNTDRQLLGFEIPASWLQSMNSFFIWSLAPVFAWLWIRLGSREPSSPAKFLWGMVLAGAGFLVLVPPGITAEAGGQAGFGWLIATYLLHTMGELCLSPVGLSAVTKLAPARVCGMMMGVWFVSIAMGNYLGGRVASFYGALPLPLLFGVVGGGAVAAGLALTVFARPIVRLMGGVK